MFTIFLSWLEFRVKVVGVSLVVSLEESDDESMRVESRVGVSIFSVVIIFGVLSERVFSRGRSGVVGSESDSSGEPKSIIMLFCGSEVWIFELCNILPSPNINHRTLS